MSFQAIPIPELVQYAIRERGDSFLLIFHAYQEPSGSIFWTPRFAYFFTAENGGNQTVCAIERRTDRNHHQPTE